MPSRFSTLKKRCRLRLGCKSSCPEKAAKPLTEGCHHGRFKICAVNGDRKACARMAHLGVLPGSELEILCKNGNRQCMVKINGGTLSLDSLTAANILVAPV